MKIQGLWMQSVGLMLFVADVDLAHDSSLTVEAGVRVKTSQNSFYILKLWACNRTSQHQQLPVR